MSQLAELNYQEILEDVYTGVRPLLGSGTPANYIPALANVSPHKFAMALETLDGEQFSLGDVDEKFSIQSISKVFNLVLAFKLHGEALWERVGIEPSGNPFDSLVQLEYEQGIPRNPFINSGAVVTIDVLLKHLKNPGPELLQFVSRLTGTEVSFDVEVARSEIESGFRNIALVNFIKAHGNIAHDAKQVLDIYFQQCAIEMSCTELARSFLFLANGGIVPGSGDVILSASQAKRVNALMLTCGFYDQAGEFAYLVGLPGKSGVGGGIVAVYPGEFTVSVWSPGLNQHGNSIAGMKALELFTTLTGKSIF